MRLVRFSPLRDVQVCQQTADLSSEFVNFQHELDKALNSFFKGGVVNDGSTSTWMPAVDIVEQETEYLVSLEIPGVDKKDVKINVVNSVLTVKGEKTLEKQQNDKNSHRNERIYGAFQRSFTLPSTAKEDHIAASYNNGVLTISIPKAEEAKPKEIEVKLQ